MLSQRRSFLKKITTFATSSVVPGFLASASSCEQHTKPETALIHDKWASVRNSFRPNQDAINLNNGAVSPFPVPVQKALEIHQLFGNALPAENLVEQRKNKLEVVRKKLATFAGCLQEEIAFTRNATEALDNLIYGIPLNAGDEVVVSGYDYPHMLNAWKKRAKQDGIVLKWVDLQLPSDDEQAMVNSYKKAFTNRTKIVMLTHIISWNGQLLPVQKITEVAQSRGIEVLVDGAHSFSQLNFRIPELGCDYFGTSLHKWLCAPFGTGMLFVKKDKIEKINPIFAPFENTNTNDIRKFEIIGTTPLAPFQAISAAIDFNTEIGKAEKQQRLHFLKKYWLEKVADLPKVQLLTHPSPISSCGMASIGIEGFSPQALYQSLKKNYGIYTSAIYHTLVPGVRISPHIYTTTEELDKLVRALEELSTI